MKTFLTFAILLLVGSAAHAVTVEDALEATCKIKVDGSIGTGCAFEVRDGEVRVLTNFHVAEGRPVLSVEFWKDGYRSIDLPASTRWWSYEGAANRDIAVVGIPLAAFANMPPPLVPLAPKGTLLYQGQTVYSAGCDDGQDPKLWKGHITVSHSREAVRFEPSSIPGQSGSALFAKNAEGSLEIVGLIAWKDPASRFGVAMTLATVYESMEGTRFVSGTVPSRTSKRASTRVPPRIFTPESIEEHRQRDMSPEQREQDARRRRIMDKVSGSACIHGVPLGTPCSDCAALFADCPGGQCPPSPYRRGFGWQFGWGGQRPQQPPAPQQPYSQPQQPYGQQPYANPGYSPYPTNPDPRGGSSSPNITVGDLETFGKSVDDKLESTRAEILERQEAIRLEHDKRISGLESLADQVKDIPAVRAAADEALKKIEQTRADIAKVDERIDLEAENLDKKVEEKTGVLEAEVDATKEQQKSILSTLRDKVDVGSFVTELRKNREEGLSLVESVKETALTRIEQRLKEPSTGSGFMGTGLATALGISGPIGVGLGVLGFFLRKRVASRIERIREERVGRPR